MDDTIFGLHLAEQSNPRQAGLLLYVVSAARSLDQALALLERAAVGLNRGGIERSRYAAW
jgi:hypothetical protein